jgi:uncharacterized membrane protein (Fun14 family)
MMIVISRGCALMILTGAADFSFLKVAKCWGTEDDKNKDLSTILPTILSKEAKKILAPNIITASTEAVERVIALSGKAIKGHDSEGYGQLPVEFGCGFVSGLAAKKGTRGLLYGFVFLKGLEMYSAGSLSLDRSALGWPKKNEQQLQQAQHVLKELTSNLPTGSVFLLGLALGFLRG